MNKRLWHLFLVIAGFVYNVHAARPQPHILVQQACQRYIASTPTNPHKLVACLQLFQKTPLPVSTRHGSIMSLIDQLYATELALLHEISHIIKTYYNSKASSGIFPQNITPAGKQLYQQAATLILQASPYV